MRHCARMQGKHDPTPPSPFEVLFDRAPIPLALSRLADGKIVAMNDTALAYVGVDRTRAIGVSGIDIGFVLPGEQAQVVAAFRRDGRVRNLEVTRRSSTGQERVLLLSAEPDRKSTRLNSSH